jgi:hypothetical protein
MPNTRNVLLNPEHFAAGQIGIIELGQSLA